MCKGRMAPPCCNGVSVTHTHTERLSRSHTHSPRVFNVDVIGAAPCGKRGAAGCATLLPPPTRVSQGRAFGALGVISRPLCLGSLPAGACPSAPACHLALFCSPNSRRKGSQEMTLSALCRRAAQGVAVVAGAPRGAPLGAPRGWQQGPRGPRSHFSPRAVERLSPCWGGTCPIICSLGTRPRRR